MKFNVSNRCLKLVKGTLIGDNADYTAEFTFDEEWTGKVKTARFIHSKYGYVDVVLEEDRCVIPVEVLKTGFIQVGVFSAEMATKYCEVFVAESIKENTGNPLPPSEDVYSQIIGMIDAGKLKGEPGEPGKPGAPGEDGKTPERGIDYWTAEDKQEVIDDVLASLPKAEGGAF